MARRNRKKGCPCGISHESLVEKELKDPKFAELYYQEEVVLDLQCAVADVAHRVVRHEDDRSFYRVLSKKCKISRKSLKHFFERGGSVRTAAKILYRLGFKIRGVSAKKLPRMK